MLLPWAFFCLPEQQGTLQEYVYDILRFRFKTATDISSKLLANITSAFAQAENEWKVLKGDSLQEVMYKEKDGNFYTYADESFLCFKAPSNYLHLVVSVFTLLTYICNMYIVQCYRFIQWGSKIKLQSECHFKSDWT